MDPIITGNCFWSKESRNLNDVFFFVFFNQIFFFPDENQTFSTLLLKQILIDSI